MPLTDAILQDSIERTAREVRRFRIPPDGCSRPTTIDRWLLASNLQKSIRRGLHETAASTARRLLEIEPQYLWSRLLVIAYEDVGLANVELCVDLLKIFRRTKLHAALGSKQVASYFAYQLAKSVKSRALCDATAAVEFNPNRPGLEANLKRQGVATVVLQATDSTFGNQLQIGALRHLSGYRVRQYGKPVVFQAPSKSGMEEVCKLAKLDALQTVLYLGGQGVAEGMNAAIPLVAPLIKKGSLTPRRVIFDFEGVNEILYAARDRHTRSGLRCLAQLIEGDRSLASFLRRATGSASARSLGSALFVVEGGLIDRPLTFTGSRQLRNAFESNFLEFHGVELAQQPTLLAMIEDRLPALRAIREQEAA